MVADTATTTVSGIVLTSCWETPVHFDNADGSFCSLSSLQDGRDIVLEMLAQSLEAASDEPPAASENMVDDEVQFVSWTPSPLAAEVQYVGMCLCNSIRSSRRETCFMHC